MYTEIIDLTLLYSQSIWTKLCTVRKKNQHLYDNELVPVSCSGNNKILFSSVFILDCSLRYFPDSLTAARKSHLC